jgi:hypothetical protein
VVAELSVSDSHSHEIDLVGWQRHYFRPEFVSFRRLSLSEIEADSPTWQKVCKVQV